MLHIRRRFCAAVIAILVLPVVLSACGSSGGNGKSATILMNWFAQAEQGGYWAAQADNLGAADGVKITVQQGGPGIQTIPQVAAGKAQFGVGNADEVMEAVSNGLPIVAIAAGFDTNLQCMMYHQSSGIHSFADLNGKMVARVPSPYWDYLKKAFNLNKVQEINYTGSMADFAHNQQLVQQCFVTSEPYVAQQQKITGLGYLSVAKDGGYNPYGNLLFTSLNLVKSNPGLVRAVVHAVVQGWSDFLTNPAPVKALVDKTNPNADPGAFDYAHNVILKGGYLGNPIGAMTDARWLELRNQMAQAGLVPANFDYTKVYTTQFLP